MLPLEEKFVVILDEPEEDVGGGDGFELIPRSLKMASPTQSLHFCWLPFVFVLDSDRLLIATGRCSRGEEEEKKHEETIKVISLGDQIELTIFVLDDIK